MSIGRTNILNLQYADGTSLVVFSTENMIALMKKLGEINAKYDLINRSKTKMIVHQAEKSLPEIREIEGIEVVNRFTYLGSIIENSESCDAAKQSVIGNLHHLRGG